MKNATSGEQKLLKAAVGTAGLWVAAQIALIVYYWGAPQFTDMGGYISMALRCFNGQEWYPAAEDVYSYFIWAPGYVNFLILQLHIFGTVNFNSVLSLLFNIAMLFEVYYLGKKFFSTRTGLISAIIFCLMHSNLFIVTGAYTETPFMFLCLSALCLVVSGKWKYIIAAAALFALANWIRPLVIIFLFAAVLYFIFTKAKLHNYAALAVPYILILLLIGAATERKIGHFVFQSTTSGFNLLMAANDEATGTVKTQAKALFIENNESLTFAEKDSIWKGRAHKWIKENPVKFTGLYLLKIPGLYGHDIWAHMAHLESRGANAFEVMASAGEKDKKNSYIKQMINKMLISVPYYLSFIFAFYAAWINRKKLFSVKSIFPAIFIAGTLITCIYPVAFRYHYPFMFTVIIYAAWGVDTLFQKTAARRDIR